MLLEGVLAALAWLATLKIYELIRDASLYLMSPRVPQITSEESSYSQTALSIYQSILETTNNPICVQWGHALALLLVFTVSLAVTVCSLWRCISDRRRSRARRYRLERVWRVDRYGQSPRRR
uniref:Transmembrane protein n=1 Tax=Madalivirus amazonaense TaxID=2956148 RepID=A0AB38ZNL5_9MONO